MSHTFRAYGHQFSRAIALALGFDPDRYPITEIRIEAGVRDVPTVSVTVLLDDESDERLAGVLRKYDLIEREAGR